jgi:hypothetical protein
MNESVFVHCAALLLLVTACNLPNAGGPVVQTTQPTLAPTNTPPSRGTVSLNNLSVTIPTSLANDALSEIVAASTDPNTPSWGIAPAHLEFTLTGYSLQNKFHQPKIYVYPTDEYAQINGNAAENINRVRSIVSGAPLSKETMPAVPSFNAGQIIAAHMQVIPFQNGSGMRMLTEYSQYFAPISNNELVYHFQGLTNDGKYYVIALLPVTAPILAETDKPDAAVPSGGVSLPVDTGPNEAYYIAVTERLNALSPEAFSPPLTILDSMIRSIVITNP